ncbi:DUF4398 domain-containing protein [Alkalimonas amylolytica]|uniref:DUF4398 domain-containing protein n=1 Tax=Alkalimonas amylolytica TaxID=152573 RepID=A0A1H4D9I7_ALKAM|nr:DUF4398 domain-containing protein [Alkalimonas amylolytica]SEA69327.1 protein of unknown function [Alkalimonas amylolytica]
MKCHINNSQATKAFWPVRPGLRWLLIGSTLLLISACATSQPPPSAELAAAERAIGVAERAQVTRYTSIELNTARQELVAARTAITAKDMPQAERLALQAQLSAELALARAELLKAREVNQDMLQSIEAVKQEAQRNPSGVKP